MTEPLEPLDFSQVVSEPVTEENPVPNHRAWTDKETSRKEPSKQGIFSRSKQRQIKEETLADRFVDKMTETPNRKGQFVKPLAEFYTGLGMTVMAFDPNCGMAIIKSADKCAESLDQLAHENETVRRWLKGFLTTNALMAVIVAHAPIVMAVLMHHVPFVQNKLAEGLGDKVEAVMKGMNE